MIAVCLFIFGGLQPITKVEFVLKDSQGEPIQYATVRALKQQVGSYSDLTGKVLLNLGTLEDTIEISHISFITRRLTVNQLKDTIVLQERKNIMADLVVRSNPVKPLAKLYGDVKRKVKMHIGLSGFEYGSAFSFNFSNKKLEAIELPILPSVVVPLVRLNIYSMNNNRPDSLLKSKVFRIKKNERKIFWRLESEPILLANRELFFSIEFMGYEVEGQADFQSEGNKKHGLTVYTTTGKIASRGFFRGKLSNNQWGETSSPPGSPMRTEPFKLVVYSYLTEL